MLKLIDSYRINVQPEGPDLRIRAITDAGTQIDATLPRSVALALAQEVQEVDAGQGRERSARFGARPYTWQARFGPIETD